jgi:hypothetical protein
MKKRSAFPLIFALIICLALSTFTTAIAAPLHDDPVVTVISGGAALETKIIPLEKLPGTTINDAGLTLPIAVSSDKGQFNGDGISVKGITGGAATVCFTIKSPGSGWTSAVHRWNGFSWEELPTVISTTEGGINPAACATIYYDGTYAVLMGYIEPQGKIVLQECANIEFIYPDVDWDWETDEITLMGGYIYPAIDEGSYVRYQLLNILPEDTVTGDLTAPGVVDYNYFEPFFGGLTSYAEFPEGTTLSSTVDWWDDNTFTVRFYFQNCYKDFDWPSDFMDA